MHGTVTWIVITLTIIVGILFYTREQYTTYPSVNERRLNVIKQMADDVLMDIKKTANPPRYIQSVQTRPSVVSGAANIPSWVYNLTSSLAVEQLRLLNPGYTVQRIAQGQPMTLDYMPKRIRVSYNPASDRVISISQG